MAVGDINSFERGSGARFNDDKIMVQYIPARIIKTWLDGGTHSLDATQNNVWYHLINFEEGSDRAIYDLMPCIPNFLEDTCKQFDFGAKKYAAWNWVKGMPWSVPLACIKRHMVKIAEGEDLDPESGVSHYGAVGCNAVMLAHYVRYYHEGDDRPPKKFFENGHDNI